VARRVEQVEGEPLMLEAHPEMPRSRSIAIQSERTRRRPPYCSSSSGGR
jgi:hypothetical protein